MACTSREYSLNSRTGIALTRSPDRLLNTVRQGDFYILTDDFDACESFREIDMTMRYEWVQQLIIRLHRHSRAGDGR